MKNIIAASLVSLSLAACGTATQSQTLASTVKTCAKHDVSVVVDFYSLPSKVVLNTSKESMALSKMAVHSDAFGNKTFAQYRNAATGLILDVDLKNSSARLIAENSSMTLNCR